MRGKMRYFVQHTEDGVSFDKVRWEGNFLYHDQMTFFRKDFGAGECAGGAGIISDPCRFFLEMDLFEVSEKEWRDEWDKCVERIS